MSRIRIVGIANAVIHFSITVYHYVHTLRQTCDSISIMANCPISK